MVIYTLSAQARQRRKERTARINRLLRFKLSDLWAARHGGSSFITNTDEGRTMLTVLLRVRTTAESAMESAPWLTERELSALRRAARKLKWSEIGALLKLTDAERTAHKLWHFRPIDVPWDEVQRRQRQRNADMDRERKRKKRAKAKELREMVSNADDRGEAILRILAGADPPPPGIILPHCPHRHRTDGLPFPRWSSGRKPSAPFAAPTATRCATCAMPCTARSNCCNRRAQSRRSCGQGRADRSASCA
jgi:hypothetical protein